MNADIFEFSLGISRNVYNDLNIEVEHPVELMVLQGTTFDCNIQTVLTVKEEI